MNQELRRAVYRKQMLYSQFTKCQSNKNWDKFRKQRNLVTLLYGIKIGRLLENC